MKASKNSVLITILVILLSLPLNGMALAAEPANVDGETLSSSVAIIDYEFELVSLEDLKNSDEFTSGSIDGIQSVLNVDNVFSNIQVEIGPMEQISEANAVDEQLLAILDTQNQEEEKETIETGDENLDQIYDSNEDAISNEGVSITAAAGLPDIVVGSLVTPEHTGNIPYSPPTQFCFYLGNGGTAELRALVEIQGFVDGVSNGTFTVDFRTSALPAGYLTYIYFSLGAQSTGVHTLKFTANPNRTVAESNYTNNTVSAAFTFNGAVDLAVLEFNPANGNIAYIYNQVGFDFLIVNIGSDPSKACKASLLNGNTVFGTINVAALPSGYAMGGVINLTFYSPGSYQLSLEADRELVNTEWTRTNNKKSTTLQVLQNVNIKVFQDVSYRSMYSSHPSYINTTMTNAAYPFKNKYYMELSPAYYNITGMPLESCSLGYFNMCNNANCGNICVNQYQTPNHHKNFDHNYYYAKSHYGYEGWNLALEVTSANLCHTHDGGHDNGGLGMVAEIGDDFAMAKLTTSRVDPGNVRVIQHEFSHSFGCEHCTSSLCIMNSGFDTNSNYNLSTIWCTGCAAKFDSTLH